MISAHIKSPFGNRDEEWQDSRVKPEEQDFIHEYQAYVIGFSDADKSEQLGVVGKYFWDIYEELSAFTHSKGGGSYPGFVAYDKKMLSEVSVNFRNYLNLEKLLFSQGIIPIEQLPDFTSQLDSIAEINAEQHNEISVIAVLMHDISDETPELQIAGMLRTLYGFCVFLNDCITKMYVVLDGLQERQKDNTSYTPLDYLRDLESLKQTAQDRQALEQDLTYARSAFNALFAAKPEAPAAS